MRGLITALRTLTVVPVPGRESEKFADSMPWFPVVGAFIGAAVMGLAWLFGMKLHWAAGAAVVCVAFATLVTGGLHVDGLGDVFDSMGGRTREKKLEIMKDPRMGSFGVVGIVLVIALKLVAMDRLIEAEKWLLLGIPFIVSRTMQVALAVSLPYARLEGGTGKQFVEGSRPWHLVLALLVAVVLVFVAGSYMGLGVLVCGLVMTRLLIIWMRRVYGGVTGDLLGMGSEVVETVLLFGLAALQVLMM